MSSSSATKGTKGRTGSFRSEIPNLSLRRMVLVGMTGAGKSSSGNTILGREAFRAAKSGSSVTKECWKETEEVAGRRITVVDTPGLFDTDVEEEKLLKQKISKSINMTAPGPHAIILVIKPHTFTEEEKLSVEKIRAIFGETADKHTIVLFTHGDKQLRSGEDLISKAGGNLKEIVSRCGERYHVFNNKDMEDRNQVVELLEKVDAMVAANEGGFYNSDSYQEVERMLKTKEEELKKLYEKKLQEKERELESRFAEEKQKLKESLKDEYKRYYEAKLREVRLEAELTCTQEMEQKIILTIIKDLTKLKCK